ncbi:hypothetical protein OSTOST_01498 [Ostertagia ostertagi]
MSEELNYNQMIIRRKGGGKPERNQLTKHKLEKSTWLGNFTFIFTDPTLNRQWILLQKNTDTPTNNSEMTELTVNMGPTSFMCILYVVLAISYILVGSGRGLALIGGYLSSPITVRQCFFEKYWPQSLILGTELPSFGIILIACERLCAVLRPGAYNRIFMGQSKVTLLAMVPSSSIEAMAQNFIITPTSQEVSSSILVNGGQIIFTIQHNLEGIRQQINKTAYKHQVPP